MPSTETLSIAAREALRRRELDERILRAQIETEHGLRCLLQGHYADQGTTICRFCRSAV